MDAFVASRLPAATTSSTPQHAATAATHLRQSPLRQGGTASLTAGVLLALCSARGAGRPNHPRAARRRAEKVVRHMCHRNCHGGEHLSPERKRELEAICEKIATPGKGITATDEGPGTIGDRFEKVGVENTEEHRRIYRQMLYETPGINNYLSAAILDPETMYQKDDEGVPFPEALEKRGIIPGVKPHLKVYELPGTKDTVMQGLDSLAVRCREYKAAGAKFAKWRSPLQISRFGPTKMAIEANMNDLARYALICQDEGLVPIVEPDIVMKGDHDLETAVAVNVEVQATLYKAMLDHGVYMEGTILKTNLVNPGLSCDHDYSVEEIAVANMMVLRRVMPTAIRGVNFLSGGQSLEGAAARLNALNKVKKRLGRMPWNISFSWSWALQAPLLNICKGQGGKIPLKEMSELYLQELAIASAAAQGTYQEGFPPDVIREDEKKDAEAKKDEPKKEEKKEEPKKDAEAKKEEPKKEEEKKEEPKKDAEAKKEEPKKEDEKKEEPKKDAEAKKEEPKKEEEKKEEPKKDAEAKKEENQRRMPRPRRRSPRRKRRRRNQRRMPRPRRRSPRRRRRRRRNQRRMPRPRRRSPRRRKRRRNPRRMQKLRRRVFRPEGASLAAVRQPRNETCSNWP
ncbi:unnamed protein product [Durusdinium trenchii]|uniref:fructose-bisphosphate aldolase n=1 Tax=Durusdinium trenchii TaxID=1381693 RepID=A0ABP0H882_9DINO